jgi:hypothetical protein
MGFGLVTQFIDQFTGIDFNGAIDFFATFLRLYAPDV